MTATENYVAGAYLVVFMLMPDLEPTRPKASERGNHNSVEAGLR